VLILSHVRHVDVITIKPPTQPGNALIQMIAPDVLVLSKSTKHDDVDIEKKKQFCTSVVLLEPQSETSTSAKLRRIQIGKEIV